MKEPHEEGVASHSAPSFAPGTARCLVKRKQGYGWAGYAASKKSNRDADAVDKAEGNTARSDRRVPDRSRVVVDPRHVQKLRAREPGDLGGACGVSHRRPVGEGK